MRPVFRYLVIIVALTAAWQLVRTQLTDVEYDARTTLRASVEAEFAAEAERYKARYGLHPYSDIRKTGRHVILVHGLDEPGKVWMTLAPALDREGYNVWIYEYPNDQPIHHSSVSFDKSLRALRLQGVDTVSIVAHSMGGLVSREMLTSPELNCQADECPNDERPAIPLLIMVGTPNAGSQLARLRAFAEIRDHVSSVIEGDWHFLGWLFDGAGEAGIDLIPGSLFLTTLNSRPHPKDTKYVVIAGIIGNDEREKLQLRLEHEDLAEPVSDAVNDILLQVGDGLVRYDSAVLPGIPHQVVAGTHTTIVRNLSKDSDRIPPAVPLVIQALAEQEYVMPALKFDVSD